MNRIEGQNNGIKDINNMKEGQGGNFALINKELGGDLMVLKLSELGKNNSSNVGIKSEVYEDEGDNSKSLMKSIMEVKPVRDALIAVSIVAALSGSIPGSTAAAETAIVIDGEMPSQKGGILGQIENSVANGKAETTVGLGVIENEKKPEQIIAEDVVSFLNSETPHTDEEIKSELITSPGKIVDLGLIKSGNDIQGKFLGYLETDDKENLLLFIGLKDRKQDRFVTALRLALYMCEDENVPYQFYFFQLESRSLISGGKMLKLRDKKEIFYVLDSLIGENVVANLITNDVKGDLMNVDSAIRFAKEIEKVGINVSRSLVYDSFNNGIKLEYSDPNKRVFMIKDGSDDEVANILLDLASDNKKVINVPIIPAISYSNTNSN